MLAKFPVPGLLANLVSALLLAVLCGCGSSSIPFDIAMNENDTEAVRRLVALNPSLARVSDEVGTTALNRAVLVNNLEMVKVLVDAGADIHNESRTHAMPLSEAAYYGHREIVEFLLQEGADVDRQPTNISSHGSGTALHEAALGAKPDIVELLVNHGADANAPDNRDGATPLLSAISPEPQSADRAATVEILLSSGADPDVENTNGYYYFSPLGGALKFSISYTKRPISKDCRIAEQMREIAECLIRHGARKEVRLSEPQAKHFFSNFGEEYVRQVFEDYGVTITILPRQ